VIQDSTCGEEGEILYTAEFENEAFEVQTKTVINGKSDSHEWNDPTYEWSSDNKTVTATRTCKNDPTHVETETVEVTSEITKEATCNAVGEIVYTAVFTNAAFTKQTKSEEIVAIGHDWNAPTYEWSSDNKTVTATRTCKNDPNHVETETVEVTSEITKTATCDEVGEIVYTAVFMNSAFIKQTKAEEIAAIGHEWNDPTYEWSSDNKTVTATRTCKNDPTHVEMETVEVTSEITKAATCDASGEIVYTAVFTNAAFTKQTKTDEIAAIGHDWNDPTYEWSSDNKTVTATRICKNDPNHVETETVEVTSEITKTATCDEVGEIVYTAVFTNPAFAKQTKTEEITAIGHDWNEPTYEWSDDNKTVTATRTCKNDPTHVETETVEATFKVIQDSTCGEEGEILYTAEFENEAFEVQTKTVINGKSDSHEWNEPTYEWSSDNKTVTATRTCKNDPTHVETEMVEVTSEITKTATCDASGEIVYTAVFTNAGFTKQTKTEEITAIGHDWNDPTYEWSSDNKTVTATRTCKNDPTHVEMETVEITSEITKTATCDAVGEIVYTAVFTNDAFAKQTKMEEITAIVHDWNEPTYEWSSDNKTVTATRTCKNDPTHVEMETVEVTSEITKTATCDEVGGIVYTAVFTNAAFAKQTKTEEITAIGHDWNEPTYEWSDDFSAVTATRTCKNDPDHIEFETVKTTSEVLREASCEENGMTRYTAHFTLEAFISQNMDVENIEAIGHVWDDGVVTKEPTESEQGEKVYTCLHNADHTKIEILPVKESTTTTETSTETTTETTHTETSTTTATTAQSGTQTASPSTADHGVGKVSALAALGLAVASLFRKKKD